MALFSAAEFSAVTGGCWLDAALIPETDLAISTDTRVDNQGKIFFALSGERFDAHNFLKEAAASHCNALCINEDKRHLAPPGIPVLLVKDTLSAMQACAAYHRQKFSDLTVFAVTGSVGKTSVKEMLYAICAHAAGKEHTLCTIGNTNNQIGVAQNLFRLTRQHRYAIIEAGTSSPGEIAPLARMIKADGAIVNSIAPCHLEKLIDLDGVAREKGAVFSAMCSSAVAVFPEETAGKEILQKAAAQRKIRTFGMDGKGNLHARFISGNLAGSDFELTFPDGRTFAVHWHLTGIHNALNAAGAAALAFSCGIPPEVIAAALPETTLPGMRMKKSTIAGVTYYNDAYNANPASMRASVDLLSSTPLPRRLILLLGGMRELGEISENAHRQLLEYAAGKLPQAIILTVGKEFDNLPGTHFDSPEEAGKYLQSILQEGDTVFAKGSRGNAVEKALPQEAR